jgi:hypothetical protein
MAIRKNADGSVTIGIIPEAQKPEAKAEKPKRGKAKTKGEG